VTGVPIQTENFTWKSSFNLSKVKNRILSTDPNNNPVNLGQKQSYARKCGDSIRSRRSWSSDQSL